MNEPISAVSAFKSASSPADAWVQACDHALRTLFAAPAQRRAAPVAPVVVDEEVWSGMARR
ncbi:MAG: hypothetical protein HC853_17555 [Anaerolineae bacterium]|nr:hypothetical protein [Anaerolineae bacterium]